MALIPQVQKHQSRLDAEELLDLDATRSDAKAAEEAPKPKPKPKEEVGVGTPSKSQAETLKFLRAAKEKFSAQEGKEAQVAALQQEINSILAENQTTDSNNK